MLGVMQPILASSNNGGGQIAMQGPITPTELPMKVNCTWSPWPGHIVWSDSSTLPPFSGSGWADDIVSIYVMQPMYVDISVTDAFSKGDYFEVYEVNGVHPTIANLIGTTPQVPVVSGSVTDPDVAFADPTYSHDTFRVLLQSGIHYFAFRQLLHIMEQELSMLNSVLDQLLALSVAALCLQTDLRWYRLLWLCWEFWSRSSSGDC